MLSCSAGLSSTISKPFAPRRRIFLDARQRRLQSFRRRRLGHKRKRAASQSMMAIFVERQHLHRDMPRRRILLQMIQHRPTQHVGQKYIQRNRCGMVLAGQRQRLGAAHGDQHLESLVVRQDRTARAHNADRLRRSATPHRRAADCRDHPRCVSIGSSHGDRRQLSDGSGAVLRSASAAAGAEGPT